MLDVKDKIDFIYSLEGASNPDEYEGLKPYLEECNKNIKNFENIIQ